jgi:predicted nucleotidyltransferase
MTGRSEELRAAAERLVAKIPADTAPEVVVTGSVSRGVADDVSDVEMLLVTAEQLDLDTCFRLAAAAGLERLGSWGPQGPETSRVSGYFEGIPFELIWWSREYADAAIDAESPAADAIAHGVSLRTCGLLEVWHERLRTYPAELAAERIEDAALTWGGFAAAGLLTIARPGERLALVERIVDDAVRVLRLVYAINRTWQPTTKRVALRAETLAVKPDRLAERIEEALSEPDPHRALIVMTRLQLDTVRLAPNGPNVDRARLWLAEALEILGAPPEAGGDHHVEAD